MNTEMETMYESLGISKKVLEFGAQIEEHLKERFEEIDKRAEFNQMNGAMTTASAAVYLLQRQVKRCSSSALVQTLQNAFFTRSTEIGRASCRERV